jgi:hypothetical protein
MLSPKSSTFNPQGFAQQYLNMPFLYTNSTLFNAARGSLKAALFYLSQGIIQNTIGALDGLALFESFEAWSPGIIFYRPWHSCGSAGRLQ